MPRNGDARALMHERLAFDRGPENVEPEKPPRIRRFGRPATKHEPAKLPEQTQGLVLGRPGRLLRRALLRLYRFFWFHAKIKDNGSKAGKPPRMKTDFHG